MNHWHWLIFAVPSKNPVYNRLNICSCLLGHQWLSSGGSHLKNESSKEVFLFCRCLISQKPRLIVFDTPIAHRVFLLINFSIQVNPSILRTDSFHVQIKFSLWLFLNRSSHLRRLIIHSISPLSLFLKLKYLSLVKIR